MEALTCPICLDLPKNPVEASCCHQIFCQSCSLELKRCPLCLAQEYTTSPSHLARRVLEQIEAKCPHPGCSFKTHSSSIKSHIEKCEFKPRDCPICKEAKPNLFELMAHLCGSHSETILKMLEEKQKDEEISEPEEAKKEEELIGSKENDRFDLSKLGENGKFYCGRFSKIMGFQYGRCGPRRGLNCPSCMKLDIQVRHLPQNHYVNSAGVICRVHSGRVYCGRSFKSLMNPERTCGPMVGPSCKYCLTLSLQLPKYKKVWGSS